MGKLHFPKIQYQLKTQNTLPGNYFLFPKQLKEFILCKFLKIEKENTNYSMQNKCRPKHCSRNLKIIDIFFKIVTISLHNRVTSTKHLVSFSKTHPTCLSSSSAAICRVCLCDFSAQFTPFCFQGTEVWRLGNAIDTDGTHSPFLHLANIQWVNPNMSNVMP